MNDSKLDSKWKGLTQKEWRRELQALLLISDVALERAIIRIWEQQTYSEQASGMSIIVDGVGFNKFDAPLMSKYARQLATKQHLSKYQCSVARKKMPKYWRQLMNISKEIHGW